VVWDVVPTEATVAAVGVGGGVTTVAAGLAVVGVAVGGGWGLPRGAAHDASKGAARSPDTSNRTQSTPLVYHTPAWPPQQFAASENGDRVYG
jgi:hypothetical protein